MIPLVSALPLTVAPPCLANDSSRPDSVIGSEPTLLTTSCGLKPSFRLFSLSSAVNAGIENEMTTWAPDARSAATCGRDVDVGVDVALLADHHRGRDLVVEALDSVHAELVVLVEVGDLLAGEVLLHVLPEDLPLTHVVELPAERLGVGRRLVPALAAGCDEHVGHLLGVEELHHGQVRGRAEAVEDRVHVVLQHQLAHDRCGGGRVVGVVEVLVDDLAPVDAAVRVDVGEVRGRRGSDLVVSGRGGSGERLVAADGDGGRGDAGRGRGQGRA